MKKAFTILLCAIIVFLLIGCSTKNNNTNLYISSSQSSPADNGVSIRFVESNLEGDKPYLDIEWVNESNQEKNFGLQFNIYKVKNGKMISCATEDLYFNLIAIILSPNSSQTERYYLNAFDLSKEGTYRFTVEDNPDRELWIDFEITKNTAISNVGGVDSSNVKAITQ